MNVPRIDRRDLDALVLDSQEEGSGPASNAMLRSNIYNTAKDTVRHGLIRNGQERGRSV